MPPYCVVFPCHTQSMAASKRLVWRQNPSPVRHVPTMNTGSNISACADFRADFFASRGAKPQQSFVDCKVEQRPMAEKTPKRRARRDVRQVLRTRIHSRPAPSWRSFCRHTALFFLAIHKVWLRQNALSGGKIPRQSGTFRL